MENQECNFTAYSKLSKKCGECENKETCEKKQMEHYGALSLDDNLYINTTQNLFIDNSIETKIFNNLCRNGKM